MEVLAISSSDLLTIQIMTRLFLYCACFNVFYKEAALLHKQQDEHVTHKPSLQ